MNCEKATELLLEGSGGGAELKAHLLKCPHCASLARELAAFAPVPPARIAPPVALDLKICTAAAQSAHAARSRRLFLRMLSGFGAAAAVAAITVSMSLFMPGAQAPKSPASQATIAWDSVSLDESLFNLETEIESAKAALVGYGRREPLYSRPDYESSIQLVSVEVPDFLT